MKLAAWTAGLIIATGGVASAQGFELGAVYGEFKYTNSRSAFNDIDTLRLSLSANFDLGNDFEVDVRLARSQQQAFGWNFNATTLSAHPRYNFSDGLSAGGYLNHTITQTPANFAAFTGLGFEILYRSGLLHLAAFYGWLTGPNIATPSQNTSLGMLAEIDINPDLSIFGKYQQDRFGFWGLRVRQAEIGLSYDLPSFTGSQWCNPELRVGVGRLNTNGVNYDQITFGVGFDLDQIPDNEYRRISELSDYNSVAVGLTFAF